MLTSVGAAQGIARAGLLEDMQIRPNVRVEIPIEIENVVDLYGIEIELEFDPTFWEFEDADDRREGIQPAIGTFLDPGMTLFNIIDMNEGRIHLVMSQVNPSEGKSGKGNILVLYATALKTGTTQFEVKKVELSTRDGIGIEVEGVDGEVRVESEAPAVTTTPIPVVDPTQIIIIPTYVPPTATPVPTLTATGQASTPRPTFTPQATPTSASAATEVVAAQATEVAEVAAQDEPTAESLVAGEVESGSEEEPDEQGNGSLWWLLGLPLVIIGAVVVYTRRKKDEQPDQIDHIGGNHEG